MGIQYNTATKRYIKPRIDIGNGVILSIELENTNMIKANNANKPIKMNPTIAKNLAHFRVSRKYTSA